MINYDDSFLVCQSCGEEIRKLTPSETKEILNNPYSFIAFCRDCERYEPQVTRRTPNPYTFITLSELLENALHYIGSTRDQRENESGTVVLLLVCSCSHRQIFFQENGGRTSLVGKSIDKE